MKNKKKWLIALLAVAVVLIICGLLAVVLTRPKQEEEPFVIQPSLLEEAVQNGRMAEEKITFSMLASTGDEQLDSIFSQLLDALVINTYWQQGEDGAQSGLSVNLSGTDVLTADLRTIGTTVYLHSDLLAGDTVAVAEDEAETVANKFIDLFEGNGTISAADAKNFRDMLSGDAAAMNPMADIDFAAMIAGFMPDAATAKEWENWVKNIGDSMEETDLSGLPEGSDPATKAFKITMTADDIVEVYDRIFAQLKGNTEYMKMLDGIANMADMTGEKFIDELQQGMAETLPSVFANDIDVIYYVNKNNELLAFTANTQLNADDGPVDLDMVYTVKTTDATVRQQFSFTGTQNDKQYMEVALTLEMAGNAIDGTLLVAEKDAAPVTATVHAAWERTDATQHQELTMAFDGEDNGEPTSIQFSMEMNATKEELDVTEITDVRVAVNGADVVAMRAEAQTGEPVDHIDPEQAKHLAEMSDDELQAWVNGLETNLQMWAITLITSLPPSILMMMMGV